MSSICDYYCLKQLKPEIAAKIRYVYIYGKNESKVFLVSQNDIFYTFNSTNIDYNYNLKRNRSEERELRIIERLSCKQVINFAVTSQYDCVFALTKDGEIYSWGKHLFDELAKQDKPLLVDKMTGKNTIDIKCGKSHCLALTRSGKVFTWGQNLFGQLGNGEHSDWIYIEPRQVNSLIGIKIVAIDCGIDHCLALSNTGVVYCWGQLGIGSMIGAIYTPFKLEIKENPLISKISCGSYYNLLLTKTGDIYGFGCNNCGQIGDSTLLDKYMPTKIITDIKFSEICSMNNFDTSVGKSQNGLCYVWGQCFDEIITKPKQTVYRTIKEVYAHYLMITYKPNYFDDISTKSVIYDRFIKSFNLAKYSDIVFKIEGRKIYVQKQYLISVCNYFRKMFAENNWIENNKNEIEITEYSYSVYYGFLKYLYTGYVDVNTTDAKHMLELANYCMEEDLKDKCVSILKSSINCGNVCDLYSIAFNYNLVKLQDFCFLFAIRNIETICETDSYRKSLDMDFIKRLFKISLKQ